MASVIPFRAIRPSRDKVHLVATRSYVGYSRRILNAKLDSNPFTFLHIIRPEHGQNATSKPNSIERFNLIRNKFESFLTNSIFQEDTAPAYYIYRQTGPSKHYWGIIAGASVQEYIDGKIKIHEQTITKREEIFKQYLEITGFNAEPVLLTYPDHKQINALVQEEMLARPEYDFSTTDLHRHELWVIDNAQKCDQLLNYFNDISHSYIADGHHRSASSAILGKNKTDNTEQAKDYFMAYFIPESQLSISEYNRLVKDLNGLSAAEFLKLLQSNFLVEELTLGTRIKPSKSHEFSMYLKGKWYSLKTKLELIQEEHPVKSLDTFLLTEHILSPLLGIDDLKTNNRISFLEGPLGTNAIEAAVDSNKSQVGFVLYPISLDGLKNVADSNGIMPPKSTWIEPKLRSGLTIYKL